MSRPLRIRVGSAMLALGFVAGGAVAERFDLDGAVSLALERNPALAAVSELRRQVEGGIAEARADAFPQIALVSSWGRSKSPSLLNSPDFAEILEQFPGGNFEPREQELYRGVVEVSQPVFKFGKVRAAVQLAELVAQAADAQIETARLDTGLAAAEAFLSVLAAREGLTTVEAEREFRRHDLERIESLLEIGEATELERLRAVAALAVVEPEIERRRGLVAVAETRLRRVLALEPDEPIELDFTRRELPEAPAVESIVEGALERRPELADLANQAQVYAKRQVVTRADSRPQVDANASWGREVRLLDNFGDPLYSAWSVSFAMRWEFFDGGRRKAQIAQFESQRQQLELRRADLAAQVRLEVDQALSDYRTARARAASTEVAAAAAQEAERVSRESYEQGVATQTDLLDAQSRAIAASVDAVAAFYDARIQGARLIRAVGQLPGTGWISTSESEQP